MRTSLFILLISIFGPPLPLLAQPLPTQPLPTQPLPTQPVLTQPLLASKPPASTQSTAIELQAGKQYPGGSRIQLPYAGITITVPKHWIGIMPVGESEFIMRSTRIKGQLKIIALPADIEAMANYMNRTLTLENDIQLIPTGNSQLTTNGTASNQYYVTNGYEPFKASIIGLPSASAQIGSGFIGLGPTQDQHIYQKLIETLASQATTR